MGYLSKIADKLRRIAGDWKDKGARVKSALTGPDSWTVAVEPHGLSLKEEYEAVVSNNQQYLIEVDQPLILISQLARSGGTLLSQLFDGHPQCHAHPNELMIDYPDRSTWPVFDLRGDINEWFDKLFERDTVKHLLYGYFKFNEGTRDDHDRFRHAFLPSLQKRLFEYYIWTRQPTTQRGIYNAYFTSYFNAWLDNQFILAKPKKYVTAFSTHMSHQISNFEKYFAVYPDGYLIRSIRDPRSWFLSVKKHKGTLPTSLEGAMELWSKSAQLTLQAVNRFPDRIYVPTFEHLVGNTEECMRQIADFTGIDFLPILTVPTFNGMPIRANSSFPVKEHGVLKEPLERYKTELSPQELIYIEEHALPLYNKIAALANRPQAFVPGAVDTGAVLTR